ncbi:hypothetical protein [Rheinheimera baltica]|uniref:hypothetical protein n=1 Tax=Rheinheimera baltica TaxID=67576 RepID=UPI0004296565|nr:hypothetical protein [Rheinheimera baltica]
MKILTVLLVLTGSALANPAQQEQQINMMLTMMERMGELERISQCVGVSQDRLKRVYRQTFAECGMGDMMSDEPSPAHQACLESSIVEHSGVAQERWEACDRDGDTEQQDDPLMAELDALSDRIGDRDPTAAEQQQMDQLIERMQQHGVAEMQQMVDAMIAGSQGSESLITLPLYPEAELLINIPAQSEMEIAEQRYETLPGASFITKASPAQVLAYYRQQLPTFQMHRSGSDTVALMQNIPPGFDYNRNMGQAFSIPHIYIQPASDKDRLRLAGAQTLFFVYYQPAD